MAKAPVDEMHNRVVQETLTLIQNSVRAAGGNQVDTLVILESVIVGVIALLTYTAPRHDKADAQDVVWESLQRGVPLRLKDLRAGM